MRFRPCIDLHQGQVKQIVGASLQEGGQAQVNFTAQQSPAHFAELYRRDNLDGGHVIMLGPGNEAAAAQALAAFPGGLHLGGGINADNATTWLQRGAGALIATSYIFKDGQLHRDNLEKLAAAVGPDRLVLDLSCTPDEGRYVVATDRWQKRTNFTIDRKNLEFLSIHCGEFLIHATAVEGLQQGIDATLVELLGDIVPIPTTYAGGIRNTDDIDTIQHLGQNRLDFTVGSALDLFGGTGLRYQDLIRLSPFKPE